MKKHLISLLILLFVLAGCGKSEKIQANESLGWMNFYVPIDYIYQPDLRGLAYTEDDRKIYVKGYYQDRSEAIIIDAIKEEVNDYLEDYIDKLNSSINGEDKYELINKDKKIYGREKYQGMSGKTTIYNFTYVAWYNSYVYSITISGPESKEEELVSLKKDVLNSIVIG